MLDRRQRDALRSEAAESLENISAIAMAIRAGEWERARRMREHFYGVMRLLDDLGWAPEDAGDQFAVTMPAGWLARTLGDLRDSTARKLEDAASAGVSESCREAGTGWVVAMRTYSVVLGAIAELGEPGAAADPVGGVAVNADEIVRRELGRMPIATDRIGQKGRRVEGTGRDVQA